MQKRGTAKKDQAFVAELVVARIKEGGKRKQRKKRTQSNRIAKPPQLAQRKLSTNDMSPLLNHRHRNRHRVRDGQANDAHTAESVKRRRRTEVNDTQQDLDDHGQHHRVERQVQTGMHLLPPLGAWDGTVASKRPRAAGGGGGAGRSTEYTKDHQGDKQADGADRGADC